MSMCDHVSPPSIEANKFDPMPCLATAQPRVASMNRARAPSGRPLPVFSQLWPPSTVANSPSPLLIHPWLAEMKSSDLTSDGVLDSSAHECPPSEVARIAVLTVLP